MSLANSGFYASPLTYAEKRDTFLQDMRLLGLVRTKGARPVVTVPPYPPASGPWNDPLNEVLNRAK